MKIVGVFQVIFVVGLSPVIAVLISIGTIAPGIMEWWLLLMLFIIIVQDMQPRVQKSTRAHVVQVAQDSTYAMDYQLGLAFANLGFEKSSNMNNDSNNGYILLCNNDGGLVQDNNARHAPTGDVNDDF